MPDVMQSSIRQSRGGQIERLATVQEVSHYLGVDIKTLYNWRYRNPPCGPTAFKVGHFLRYKWDDVERWLAESRVSAA